MNFNYRSTLLLISFLLLTVLTVFFIRPHLETIDQFLINIGWLGPIAVISLYTLLAFTPIPTDPFTIMLGALYGPVWGLGLSWAGNTSAALAEYYVAHHIGHLTKFESLKHKLPWGLANAPIDSVWFLTLGRLAPGWGSKIVSVLAGLLHVNFWRYLWTTSLMNLLGSVGYILFGYFSTRWF